MIGALTPDPTAFGLFLAASLLIALSPGPGLLYVAARSLAGGRRDGLASSLGTGLGGLVHVLAGTAGVGALVLASAEAFALLKLAGAAYLVWLGVRTWRDAARDAPAKWAGLGDVLASPPTSARQAFREGVIVEALNPKTAAFFLAFIPHFVDAGAGWAWLQFACLGLVSVGLNTAADLAVAVAAGVVRRQVATRPRLVCRLRQGSGVVLCGLGLSLALARRPT